jgi:hypothetical protein
LHSSDPRTLACQVENRFEAVFVAHSAYGAVGQLQRATFYLENPNSFVAGLVSGIRNQRTNTATRELSPNFGDGRDQAAAA